MIDLPKIKTCLNTSEDDLVAELYSPCLRWAERFDRGVGYFTSGWITNNLCGLSDFAMRGGKIRLITSPIMSNNDVNAIIAAKENKEAFELLEQALQKNVQQLQMEMEKDIYNTFAWMIHDEIIDMKFALPCHKLNNGNFHDKFGIFYCGQDTISFAGSINDSAQGLNNYESIKIFKSWSGTKEYIDADIARFEKIWSGSDRNLKIYSIPSAIKNRIFQLRTGTRPYPEPKRKHNKWKHQDIAVEKFLENRNGILCMATGTGKTVTAIKIMKNLFSTNTIKRVVITMAGNDLLDQWATQMRSEFKDKPVFSQYGHKKEMNKFIIHTDNALMLLSSDAKNLTKLLTMLETIPGDYFDDTLFIFDEVHGVGSSTRVENLSGKLSPYIYRLGLSATPEREYDEDGNSFIEEEIGPVLYRFTLDDAIKKGILCSFNYIPLPYELSNEEKRKKRDIIGAFNAKKKNGELVSESDLYTQLSIINKTAKDKLIHFRNLIETTPELLSKCIIFVQDKEYGKLVQDILISHIDKYHTYYADDEKGNLIAFPGNWNMVIDVANMLKDLDVPVQTIDFGHPNFRDSNIKKHNEGKPHYWKKEHQVKIWANEFLPVGFNIAHKQKALETYATELLLCMDPEQTHKFYWEKQIRRRTKPVHPAENDHSLPSEIQGRHFESWTELAEVLGYHE